MTLSSAYRKTGKPDCMGTEIQSLAKAEKEKGTRRAET